MVYSRSKVVESLTRNASTIIHSPSIFIIGIHTVFAIALRAAIRSNSSKEKEKTDSVAPKWLFVSLNHSIVFSLTFGFLPMACKYFIFYFGIAICLYGFNCDNINVICQSTTQYINISISILSLMLLLGKCIIFSCFVCEFGPVPANSMAK